jgi:hypothetical protein
MSRCFSSLFFIAALERAASNVGSSAGLLSVTTLSSLLEFLLNAWG